MTLKLNGSTDGSVTLQAPADTSPTGTDKTFTLPTADGTSGQVLSTNGSGALSFADGGKILQVVQTVKTDVFSESLAANTNSSTNAIEVDITPTSTSNKILVMVTLHGSSSYWGSVSAGAWQGRLVRDGSDIVKGDAAGSRNRMTFRSGDSGATAVEENCVFTYLDSPATTSQVTYGCRLDNVDNGSATMYLNRSPGDSDSNTITTRTASTITVMEVAA